MFQHVDINPRTSHQDDEPNGSILYPNRYSAGSLRDANPAVASVMLTATPTNTTPLMAGGGSSSTLTLPNGKSHGMGLDSETMNASIRELDEVQRNVVATMSCRLKAGFLLLVIPQTMLLFTIYWYTTVISMLILAGAFVYCWTHRERKSDFILIYSGLILLNWVKDVVLTFFFFFAPLTDLTPYEYVVMLVLIVDAGLFTPYSIYYCFWLHRSLSVTILSF